MPKFLVLFMVVVFFIFPTKVSAQYDYGYGTVIGGENSELDTGMGVQSLLEDNERGVRVVLIQSQGGGIGGIGGMGMQQGQQGGGIRIYDVPVDTDFLELIVFYGKLDPRSIRKSKIKLLRLKSTGNNPFLSKDIYRYWTHYDFNEEYKRGGPFTLVQPGDIIIVERRGIFNRPFFDPLTDITFLLTLPTLILSFITIYNTFTR